jgi:hypothetical protein
LDEVKGNISNTFHFTIKDLYKKDAHRITSDIDMLDCEHCGVILTAECCLYCAHENKDGIKEAPVKNWNFQRPCEMEEKSVECMIIMVDLSGSMNLTYPSKYRKTNRDYVVRAIGSQNFEVLRKAIGEEEVIKNYKSVETLLQSGETVRDIAFSLRE